MIEKTREELIEEGYEEGANGVLVSPEEILEMLKWELYSREQDIKKILQEALEITEDALKDAGEENDNTKVA
tara:strand:+ start:2840 stop:3055 length:216 start_codon:yes stop_codon:yes gene_type:complete